MTGFVRFLTLLVVAGIPIVSEAAAPDPSDPAASVPAVVPGPALAGYRKAIDPALAGWAEVHRDLGGADASGMHDGHAAHDTAPSTASEQDPHAGHRMERQ
jgi:hypothetical protein